MHFLQNVLQKQLCYSENPSFHKNYLIRKTSDDQTVQSYEEIAIEKQFNL